MAEQRGSIRAHFHSVNKTATAVTHVAHKLNSFAPPLAALSSNSVARSYVKPTAVTDFNGQPCVGSRGAFRNSFGLRLPRAQFHIVRYLHAATILHDSICWVDFKTIKGKEAQMDFQLLNMRFHWWRRCIFAFECGKERWSYAALRRLSRRTPKRSLQLSWITVT